MYRVPDVFPRYRGSFNVGPMLFKEKCLHISISYFRPIDGLYKRKNQTTSKAKYVNFNSNKKNKKTEPICLRYPHLLASRHYIFEVIFAEKRKSDIV